MKIPTVVPNTMPQSSMVLGDGAGDEAALPPSPRPASATTRLTLSRLSFA